MKKRLLVLFSIFLIFLVGAVENPIDTLSKKQGIDFDSVKNVTSVNKSILPSEIKISKVEENNIDIKQVDYEKNGEMKKMFVISFTSQGVSQFIDESKDLGDIFVFSGVEDFEHYVMLQPGSLVGLSSYVEYEGNGKIYIEVLINGESSFISNEIFSSGQNYDFELESLGIDTFSKGDVLSLNIIVDDGIVLKEVNSIVKVE